MPNEGQFDNTFVTCLLPAASCNAMFGGLAVSGSVAGTRIRSVTEIDGCGCLSPDTSIVPR